MSEDEQRRILRLLAIEKEQRRSHESLKKWATENFAILGHWKRAAEIKERAAENFSVLKSAPAKACSKKCTVGSKVLELSILGGWSPPTTTATLEISSVHMNVRSSLLPSSPRKLRWGRSRSWATRISSPLECGRLVRDSASVPRQPPGSHNRFVCSNEIAWMFNVIGIF